jgi:hypothetical protein
MQVVQQAIIEVLGEVRNEVFCTSDMLYLTVLYGATILSYHTLLHLSSLDLFSLTPPYLMFCPCLRHLKIS